MRRVIEILESQLPDGGKDGQGMEPLLAVAGLLVLVAHVTLQAGHTVQQTDIRLKVTIPALPQSCVVGKPLFGGIGRLARIGSLHDGYSRFTKDE